MLDGNQAGVLVIPDIGIERVGPAAAYMLTIDDIK
jgi:hypothetical protein